jgi:hypothetical protein
MPTSSEVDRLAVPAYDADVAGLDTREQSLQSFDCDALALCSSADACTDDGAGFVREGVTGGRVSRGADDRFGFHSSVAQ